MAIELTVFSRYSAGHGRQSETILAAAVPTWCLRHTRCYSPTHGNLSYILITNLCALIKLREARWRPFSRGLVCSRLLASHSLFVECSFDVHVSMVGNHDGESEGYVRSRDTLCHVIWRSLCVCHCIAFQFPACLICMLAWLVITDGLAKVAWCHVTFMRGLKYVKCVPSDTFFGKRSFDTPVSMVGNHAWTSEIYVASRDSVSYMVSRLVRVYNRMAFAIIVRLTPIFLCCWITCVHSIVIQGHMRYFTMWSGIHSLGAIRELFRRPSMSVWLGIRNMLSNIRCDPVTPSSTLP